MKKIFVLILGLNFCFAYAQKKTDPVVMTIEDMEVPLSEFLFLAQKDSGVNLLNKKSLQDYVELFKTYKLKVADAKSLRIQESIAFQSELSTYQAQLIGSYLYDKEGQEQAMRHIYEISKELLSVSHILFELPAKSLPKDTLEVFNKANEVYKRIKAGEDFSAVGQALMADESADVIYEDIEYVFPLQTFKVVSDAAYALSEGDVSAPIRSPLGFHIIRLNRKATDNVRLQVAHILIQTSENYTEEDDLVLLQRANEIYEKAINGEDFGELAMRYSNDMNTIENGGLLPYFGRGYMVLPFEQAAFALKNIGDISAPVKTRYGYHIIKLIDTAAYPPYKEVEESIYRMMQQGDWNHELVKSFDEKQKAALGYKFNQEAYNELVQIADNYFPTDTAFYNRAVQLAKPVMFLEGKPFPQFEFADYVRLKPQSLKTFSGDYLAEQYIFFVREIIKKLTEMNLEKNQEFNSLMNEYYDGILLFEVSNTRVWEKPFEEHEALEQAWLNDLNQKYKVTINWKVLNNLKKYLKKQ